ncbi:MAG: glycosyltransferase family 2 protein [Planctomycetes bacterium]|nr:glycosyltransferase family 2 protein [Planctomycetota bacterium]
MKVSVVTVAHNRPVELGLFLDSLLNQSTLPAELIVVDNGSNADSGATIRLREQEFASRGVSVRCVRHGRNSLAAGRNLGARLSSGDIIMFLDDDVLLDKDYLREILKVYEEASDALGVQGHILAEVHESRGRDRLLRLFFLSHREPAGCRLLPSLCTTYPIEMERVARCQWLSGSNHSYRRGVLEEFRYDERLIKYCDGEDIDFSYRVLKKYPGSLFITPFAKLTHRPCAEGRAPGRETTCMREIYRLYLLFKLFDPTLRSISIFVWSRVGYFALALGRAVLRRPPGGLSEIRYLLGAYWLCLRHLREIRRGSLDFFNRTIQ